MSGNDFEARLRAARDKAGLAPPAPAAQSGRDNGTPSAMSVGLRVGVELLSALIVGLAIGYFLDRWLHTMPLFLIVFVVLGGVAGVLNVYRTLMPKPAPGKRLPSDDMK